MTWYSPWAFLLLIVLGLLTLWSFVAHQRRRPSLQFSSLSSLRQVPRGLRSHLIWLPLILKIFGLALVILALARPQRADVTVQRSVEGIDIVLVLDISDSMLIEDMQPENRLEAAKSFIRDFIAGRTSDRIGLVVFAGEAYTRVPLTLDYEMLLQNVEDVVITRNIKMGTAIGMGLATAVARLKESTAESRVIIFLTDGENNTGTIDPLTALDMAKGYGLRIHAVGIGRDGQAQLPVYMQDARGQRVKRYRPIYSQINEELLKKMAGDTGGAFFRANTTDALAGVFKEIDRLERTEIQVNEFTRYEELFPPFLKWGLGVYALGILLGRSWLRRNP